MRKMLRYTLEIASAQTIQVPKDHVFLSCQVKAKKINVWALVKEDQVFVNVHFKIYGDGHDIDDTDDLEFLGTCQIGPLILHVFKLNTT